MVNNNQKETAPPKSLGYVRRAFASRFSLFSDKAEDDEIERRIRDGVELSGATPWILIFAIFIASIGLNVNSTAVIIGAMLISPLMGPIMGAGLGVAVYDFPLVKRALFNLGIATLISLIVSALYFAVSPLQDAQSELLARTTPTIWDVLVALFGGMAGIVGVTRNERSNVIPGVAIATALMPPVCTAGFGVASGQWDFVGGALYLYTINCVFIGLATVIGLRVLRLKRRGFSDIRSERRVKLSLLAIALGTTIPSAYFAVNLVNAEVFKSNVSKFVAREFSMRETHVATLKINPVERTIEVALIGVPLSQSTLRGIEGRLAIAGLDGSKLIIHQANENNIDVAALKTSLLRDLYTNGQEELRKSDERIKKLQQEIDEKNAIFLKADDIYAELRAQYPLVTSVTIGEGVELLSDSSKKQIIQLSVRSSRPLSKEVRSRIDDWFKVRIKSGAVAVNFSSEGNGNPYHARKQLARNISR
jgi:uncharacterized hydrophobic protein (TIGR00271 family)